MNNIKLIQNIIEAQKYEQMFYNFNNLSKNIKIEKGKWYKQFDKKRKKRSKT